MARITAAAMPAAVPSRPDGPGAGAPTFDDAEAQVAADPLQQPGPDGWTPAKVTVVKSRNEDGFIKSAIHFVQGGVDEQPGQRMSTAQVDALAPFYATEFGLDENFVRGELAKVYFYVGGPAAGSHMAMTFGHHIFMPDESSLRQIMSPDGKRWLSHELTHTMQYLAYQDSNTHRDIAAYATSQVIAHNPEKPGAGGGPLVWGTLFSAMRTAGKPESEIGSSSTSLRDRAMSSLLPAAVLSVPISVIAGGALSAGRATTSTHILGSGNAMRTSFGGIAAPALAGATIGAFGDSLGPGWSGALGAVAGGALAGATLWKGGAFLAGGSHATTELGHSLGRGAGIALAVGATLAGAAIGYTSARTSANTINGWSSSAPLLRDVHARETASDPEPNLTFTEAMHDSDWLEIDAEASARAFVRGTWQQPAPGSGPVQGRVPQPPSTLDEKIQADVTDRLDWGVKLPFLVGVPAAIGVGAGVLATRGTTTVLKSTLEQGNGLGSAIGDAMRMLGSQKRGVVNSVGVGGAVTVMPLMAGGIAAPFVYNVTGSTTAAKVGGGISGAVVGGALLTLLLKGKGSGLIATSGKVAAGMAVAGALGLVAGGVATDAMRQDPRHYDVTKGVTAGA
jgi:hypothetical protein